MSTGSTEERPLGPGTGTGVVVASMVGAGIFTTSGLLAESVGDETVLLAAWAIGGALALAGALSYAELGGMMPQAGGEYVYIRRVYGATMGFLSGFVSLVAGFAAPIGGVCLVLGHYLGAVVPILPERVSATAVVIILTAAHARGVHFGARVNNAATLFKIGLVLLFIIAGFLVPAAATPGSAPAASSPGFLSGAFATALVLVAFAYTGWNAAAYIGGEIRDPGRNLPKALIAGTASVTVLYLLLNLVYLRAASPRDMAGVIEIGDLAAQRLFGSRIGVLFDVGIVLVLFSTASAFIMAGPRVLLAMSRDGEAPAALGRLNRRGSPRVAVIVQGAVALPFVWIADLDSILRYVGLTLSLFAGLAVFGVLILRRREPDLDRPFRVPAYPFTPFAFVLLSAWMIAFSVKDGPVPAYASAGTLVLGLGIRGLLRVVR